MIFLLILLLIAVVFVVDLFIAFVAGWIAPYTGLPLVDTLDFWNWFWIVILAQLLTSGGSATNIKS